LRVFLLLSFPSVCTFSNFFSLQTGCLTNQAPLHTSLDTYSCSCLTFAQHIITLLSTFTQTLLCHRLVLRHLTLLNLSSWRTNKITTRPPPFPLPFLTKFNTLNIILLKLTATLLLLLRLPSLLRQALGFHHTAILRTPPPPAVTQEA
jgi:hypothetical protein